MSLKQKIGLATDTAGDLKGAVYAMSAVIVAMDPGWDRTVLIALFLIVMAVISWLQVGNIRPEIADQITEHYENDGYVIGDKGKPARTLEEVLKEGRE